MDKMRMESVNRTEQNIEKIRALFPNVITETKDENGKLKKAINFELLKQMLSDEIIDGDEAYEFTWVGKKASIVEAGKPIRKTLRPCKEESKDWYTTENLFIEGDNLDVLKLLQESYLGAVKMIYIDPPYNTGKDFIYRDNFRMGVDDYNEASGVYDEEENRLFKNSESNGRFHSDWCTMMYPRLLLVRNLLADDGVIFISIDDNEINNLKQMCLEIFGETNFISQIVVQLNPRGRQSDTFMATVHEYVLCFAKNSASCKLFGMPLTEEQKLDYSFSDEIGGAYRLLGLRQRGSASRRQDRPDMYFPIYVNLDTEDVSLEPTDNCATVLPKKSDGSDGRWMWGREKCKNEKHRLVARLIKPRNKYDIFIKDYLTRGEEERTRKFRTIWDDKKINNQAGTQEVKRLLNGDWMSFPKSRELLNNICTLGSDSNGLILDFFSGSATTAHSVMELNSIDGGHRRFIMVQLPESIDIAGSPYKNICELGKDRIRRAGEKIKEEASLTVQGLDIGFRVLKLDSTNMKDVYYSASEYSQNLLEDLTSNIKDDRTDLDLLYSCLLEWGLPLSLPHTSEEIDGVTVHTINDGDLIACFADNISETVIKEIARRQPLRVVFRDSGFASSPEKINVEEIFKLITPNTSVKVL